MNKRELEAILDWAHQRGFNQGSNHERDIDRHEKELRQAVRRGRVLEAQRNEDSQRVLDLVGGAE